MGKKSAGCLSVEAREARRVYKRKWQKDNPDKIKEYQKRYWQKVADEFQALKERSEAERQRLAEQQNSAVANE